ncbi:MAG TPA: poly(R)-hydroxyalkanoic acid synthase subunit PhaE [Anaerolineales bacterium]|nr:poly(R)-hydroxyalkanoic acid synthase subunit PhaE [Anaerolineales bacterium]
MSEEGKSDKSTADPFAQMIQFYDAMSKSWAKAMSEAVSSESFAKSMGEQMEGSLEVAAVMRKQMAEVMEKYLEGMSLPSRKDVISVAERLNKIEMALDDLDAKLDDVLAKLAAVVGDKKK